MNAVVASDRLALESIVAELARAWNVGDASSFAALFARDAEQVTIFGAQLVGRGEIERRHDEIFRTIFLASTNTIKIIDARSPAPDILLARISSEVKVSQGPLQGELHTIASLVLCRTNARWEIVLFHNTRVASEAVRQA